MYIYIHIFIYVYGYFYMYMGSPKFFAGRVWQRVERNAESRDGAHELARGAVYMYLSIYLYLYIYIYIYIYMGGPRGKVPYSTSCATFPPSAQREGAVLYQLCHLSSKRLEEKWHNWYSTAPFLYTRYLVGGVRVRVEG